MRDFGLNERFFVFLHMKTFVSEDSDAENVGWKYRFRGKEL